ncbi:DUF2730 family protein [Sinirhodobacter populi]|uniref:DUF2730 family protein n=1 Tax=Paenirhodobacter populi TaxID=2306993 RepID=A0A443K217_9RHOB|nr:DUF2730 family protein [Sinirhodobacter populi]RWR26807.1 DUF2730 family protein [Sinirhodobacter populi]
MGGETLNISPLVAWVIALTQLLTFGLAVWNLVSSGTKANARRLDEHAALIQGHGDRLALLEMARKEGPTQKDFHDLDLRMTKLQGALEVMIERLKPVEAIAIRLQEAAIEQGRAK